MTDSQHHRRSRPLNRRMPIVALAILLAVLAPTLPARGQETGDLETTGGKKKHRQRQDHPIRLGTSGSNVEDISGGFCCNGTLGALVEKDGRQYILSNNHVIGRSNSGRPGEPIIQPGYSDQSCPARDAGTDTVARLSARKRIKFGFERQNKADVAIAEVVPGATRSDGDILKIGVPGSRPVEAFVGMEVKKSGRTTGLTRGVVTAVDATVIIEEFPLDCAGTETRVARFVDQIIISGVNGKRFLDAGDSGSMVYEDVDRCPSPVGLLFAGGNGFGAAAPASTVLKTVRRLKPRGDAEFVGCGSSGMQVASNRRPLLQPGRVRDASEVKREWEEDLLRIRGVQAVGIGMTLSGPLEPAIWIFATDIHANVSESLPGSLGGFRIEVIPTDKFEAYCRAAGSD